MSAIDNVQLIEFLRKVSILRELSPEQLARFVGATRPVEVPRGKNVITEGETGDTMFILVDGKVEVSKNMVMRTAQDEYEDRDKILTVLDAQTHRPFFGEIALLEQGDRTATVRALTDCQLRVIDRAGFEALCAKDRELGFKLVNAIAAELCGRLRRSNTDILKLTTALSLALRR